MPVIFSFDVFLDHAPADAALALDLAAKLKANHIKVWLEAWEGNGNGNTVLPQWRTVAMRSSRKCLRLDTDKMRLWLDENTAQKGYISFDWHPEVRAHNLEQLVAACRTKQTKNPDALFSLENGQIRASVSLGHTGRITAFAFSPDSKWLLSASEDFTIRLADSATGRCVKVYESAKATQFIAWSPDSEFFLAVADDGSIQVWETETGTCRGMTNTPDAAIFSACWGPGGNYILSGGTNGTLRIWDVGTGSATILSNPLLAATIPVSWSPDGRKLLIDSLFEGLHVWDIAAEEFTRRPKIPGKALYSAWSPDSRWIAIAGEDHVIRIWDPHEHQCIMEIKERAVRSLSWSPDSRWIASGSRDQTIRIWDTATGKCTRLLRKPAINIAWSPDGRFIAAQSRNNNIVFLDASSGEESHSLYTNDGPLACGAINMTNQLVATGGEKFEVYNISTGRCARSKDLGGNSIKDIKWHPDGLSVTYCSTDYKLNTWYAATGKTTLKRLTVPLSRIDWSAQGFPLLGVSVVKTLSIWSAKWRTLINHPNRLINVDAAKWSNNSKHILLSSDDYALYFFEQNGDRQAKWPGHTAEINDLAWSPDDRYAASGSNDSTVRIWEVATGKCLHILEGHTGAVTVVSWSPDGNYIASGASNGDIRIWDTHNGNCRQELKRHRAKILALAWDPDSIGFYSMAENGVLYNWSGFPLDHILLATAIPRTKQVRYTNARILLVGDSGVGKSGLARRLTGNEFADTASTDGAWATHCPLPSTTNKDDIDREIWLWDFAGQVDYRLVHQLFMEDAAAAILLFNPQQDDPFEGLGHWDADLQKASHRPFARLLAAGRIDRGGLLVSDDRVDSFIQEKGFLPPLHLTSALTGEGCETLRNAVIAAIDWDNIPVTTSPASFRRLKKEILKLRDNQLTLIHKAELKECLTQSLADDPFEWPQLETVINLLAGPGIIRRLDGDMILLRPEILSRYAAALIRKVRKSELGCIGEKDLRAGNLDYQDFVRLPARDEETILRTLYETLVKRAWCLRQPADDDIMLIFPSYFRRERPDQPNHPNTLVTYRFSGPIDDIYATLVVRLLHTTAFTKHHLWKDAADLRTQLGEDLGFKLIREAEGVVRLEVYFQPSVDDNSRLVFLRYIHDHLSNTGTNLVRLRHYFCLNTKCSAFGRHFMDQPLIDDVLKTGPKPKIFCPACGKPILLNDVIEKRFDAQNIQEEASKLAEESRQEIDNESRELKLIGHTFSVVAEAGHIFRPTPNSDHGIDGEIEFKDEKGEATGQRLYVQLKSGDSHLKKRKRDGVDIFKIGKARWASYWQSQAYPVMLIIRNSDDTVRWMEISSYLKQASKDGIKKVTSVVFEGKRFDAGSVQQWRDKLVNLQTK